MKCLVIVLSVIVTCLGATHVVASWRSETFTLTSSAIQDNLLGISHLREVRVWLPSGYSRSKKRYPAIYYIHNLGWSQQQLHEHDKLHETFARAVDKSKIRDFIFVAGDFTAQPWPGTFFGNNQVVGRWVDYIVDEIVPAVDKRYRTLASASSRGISGDFLGGYGAIRTVMDRPGVFSSVYALHPVGTGSGDRPMTNAPDWRALNQAQSREAIENSGGLEMPFLLMAQSHAPNPNRPPFYADLMVDLNDDALTVNTQVTTTLRDNFLLIRRVPDHVDALKALNGFMFDWSRYDENRDHVIGNRRFTNELLNYGIEHVAEEHGNDPWWRDFWTPYGRVEDRLLPFFDRHLVFD